MLKVLVTGGYGFLGKHLLEELDGHYRTCAASSQDFDLRCDMQTSELFSTFWPIDIVINLAANVGGIGYNVSNSLALYQDNLLISYNVINEAYKRKVKKFIQIGTVCSYPKNTQIPFREEDLWNGYPEKSNAPYGMAKKMSLTHLSLLPDMSSCYLIPTNMYGPGDNFDPEKSHVIPAMIHKFLSGEKEILLWGSGLATRDFVYVKDVAKAIRRAIDFNYRGPINLGSGQEISMKSLAELIEYLTNQSYKKIIWDETKPEGQPRRLLDISKARKYLNWKPETTLADGLRETIAWYQKSVF